MYEQTINIEKSNGHLLSYVKGQMETALCQIDGISTELNDEYRNYYTLACADAYRFQMSRAVNSAVCDALSLGYKNVYMRGLLDVDYDNFYQNVLVNTICIFDSEYDKQFVSRLMTDSSTLCLDGYYNFKMSRIKRKWEDISRLVSDNSFILNDNDLIAEFLQYLLESMTEKESSLSVSLDADGFSLFNKENKSISKIKSLARSVSIEEEAMLNIICIKPSKLTVYYHNKPSQEFCEMAEALFLPQYVCVE